MSYVFKIHLKKQQELGKDKENFGYFLVKDNLKFQILRLSVGGLLKIF